MKDARDFDLLVGYPIEYQMRVNENRTQLRRQLISRSRHERVLRNPLRHSLDIKKKTVSDVR